MVTAARTDEEVFARVRDWHRGAAPDKELHEYLGWTWAEYRRWVVSGHKPVHTAVNTEERS